MFNLPKFHSHFFFLTDNALLLKEEKKIKLIDFIWINSLEINLNIYYIDEN